MAPTDLHFTTEQEPQVESYRPLSGLAVIAFLLGVLSPLAIFSAYFLVVPIAGVVFAMAALRRIAGSGGEFSGRRLALVALVASCFFGAWTGAQDLGRPWIISNQARQFCDAWLQLWIDGKVLEAHQWTLEPHERVAATIPLASFYDRNNEGKERLKVYFQTMPFQADADGSSLRSYRFLGNVSVTSIQDGGELVVHRYEIVHERDGETRTDTVLLTARRSQAEDARFIHWQLREVRREDPNLLVQK